MSKIYLQNTLQGIEGQVIGYDDNGNAIAEDFSGGFSPRILYTAASGMTVTATKGSTIITASYSGGQYIMTISEFGTWTTSNGSKTGTVVVSEVTDYDAGIIGDLKDTSWAQIKQASDEGKAASYWNIGDCKSVVMNGTLSDGLTLSNKTLWVFIIGFDHDISTELPGGHTITFNGFKTSESDSNTYALIDSGYQESKTSGTWFNMNNSSTNTNSWKGSRMRSEVMPKFISVMPSDLQAVLKTVTKQSIKTYNATTLETVEDKMFLLSESEIFGTTGIVGTDKRAKTVEESQYAWFANKGIKPSSYSSNVRYQYKNTGATTSTCGWWERSPYYDDSTPFCTVFTNGSPYFNFAANSYGVAPAFNV